MAWILATGIGGIVLLLYATRMLKYAMLTRAAAENSSGQQEPVTDKLSLLVPFRNEAEHLPALLQALHSQNYPADHFEVIFINDHSGDASADIIQKALTETTNMRLIELREQQEGKKAAISAGIEAAMGSRIIQTDADCILPPGFVRSHALLSHKYAGSFIAGPVVYKTGHSVWSKLQALEFFSLVATGMASFFAGRPVMCNAANISYDQSFYLRNREALQNIPSPSGDDVFLMTRAKKEGLPMLFLTHQDAWVQTYPAASIAAFFKQRIRWGSKARYYSDPGIAYLAVLVFLTNAFILGTLIAACFSVDWLWIFALSLVIKSAADYFLIRTAAVKLRQRSLLKYFPLLALFYYFYLVLAGLFSLLGSYTWKGRKTSI